MSRSTFKAAPVFAISFALSCALLLLAGCSSDFETTAGDEAGHDGKLRVTGELQSSNSVFFGPPPLPDTWDYTIAYMASDGARVKQGQPILRFNTNDLENQVRDKTNKRNEKQKELDKQVIVTRESLADLRLALEEARAEADKALLIADIPESLLPRRDYQENQLNLQLAEIDVKLRQAELEKEERVRETEEEILRREIAVLQADISRLEQSIGTMNMAAPRDGVVIHIADRRNSKPSIGDQIWRGRRVIELPDLEHLEVNLEIPERDSATVAVGQSVGFVLDAAPDRRFEGTITELASVIRSKSRFQPARVFDAIVRLENPDSELMRPGMSVTAEILLDTEREGP